MEKSSIQTDKSSIFKRDERSQRPSTSSTSFEITEQQHRNSNSFMNPIPNNNNNNNNKGKPPVAETQRILYGLENRSYTVIDRLPILVLTKRFDTDILTNVYNLPMNSTLQYAPCRIRGENKAKQKPMYNH
ncbi:unnamed protein product [Rotaria magnacalcarata]|uniref:Uncharacterized protein n=1 Tax=Rotaria magnacalcarata TaxID=392030 RepID=A0A8S2U0Q3_9BILA|nr:unnamed protein product [Rotaria magnacalcarata]